MIPPEAAILAQEQKTHIEERFRENAFKMLVSSLSAAFVTGRTLYGQNVRTLDEVFDLIGPDHTT